MLKCRTDKTSNRYKIHDIGIGDGSNGARAPKIKEKNIFSGNHYVKFGHFSGKNHVKFVNFVNFSAKYDKNSGILIIFRAGIM